MSEILALFIHEDCLCQRGEIRIYSNVYMHLSVLKDLTLEQPPQKKSVKENRVYLNTYKVLKFSVRRGRWDEKVKQQNRTQSRKNEKC